MRAEQARKKEEARMVGVGPGYRTPVLAWAPSHALTLACLAEHLLFGTDPAQGTDIFTYMCILEYIYTRRITDTQQRPRHKEPLSLPGYPGDLTIL